MGICEFNVNRGVPILQSFALYMVKLHNKPLSLNVVDNYRFFVKEAQGSTEITDEARITFFNAYNITPGRQIDYEIYFNNLSTNLEIIDVENPTLPEYEF